jgi:hypothetical protein
MAQVVESLPTKYKALSSNSRTARKKKGQNESACVREVVIIGDFFPFQFLQQYHLKKKKEIRFKHYFK